MNPKKKNWPLSKAKTLLLLTLFTTVLGWGIFRLSKNFSGWFLNPLVAKVVSQIEKEIPGLKIKNLSWSPNREVRLQVEHPQVTAEIEARFLVETPPNALLWRAQVEGKLKHLRFTNLKIEAPTLDFSLDITIPSNLTDLLHPKSAHLEISSPKTSESFFTLQNPAITLLTKPLTLQLSAPDLSEKNPKIYFDLTALQNSIQNANLQIGLPSLNLQGSFQPKTETGNGFLKLSDAEVLNGNDYYDLNLSALPLEFLTTPEVRLKVNSHTPLLKGEAFPFQKTFSIQALDLRRSSQFVARALGAQASTVFEKLFVRRGTLQMLTPDLVSISDLEFLVPSVPAHAQEISVRASLRDFFPEKIEISIPKFAVRHLAGRLDPLTLSLKAKPKIEFWTQERLPLHLQGIDSEWKPASGSIGDGLQLFTGVRLKNLTLEQINRDLCIGLIRTPPAKLDVQFNQIEWNSSENHSVDILDGAIRGSLFDGFFEFTDLGFFNIDSSVPELDLSFLMRGVRLDQLGEWLNYGEMNGTLEASLQDAVVQGWLPTQFSAQIEAKPFSRNKVVFSPDAMKNTIRLFAGQEIDQIPGVANWLAFGWPSRVFGGYDVNHAGIRLLSTDGTILLETLDPPEIVNKERKHFIIYGPRFKMPLQTRHYPLVMDAVAMGNFVRQVILQLRSLSSESSKNTEKTKTTQECKLPYEIKNL